MYTLVYQYVHSSFLLTCPAGSFLWKEIRNILRNLNREQQAQSTYFSHAASLLKCFKTGTQAAEIVLTYLSSQVSADCQQQLWAVVLSEAFTVSEGRTYVNSHVLGLMENTERARRGKDHGHPQKHTHTISRTNLDVSEERSIICCSIQASVLKSNKSELCLRKKKLLAFI